jgi:hypothetical protein
MNVANWVARTTRCPGSRSEQEVIPDFHSAILLSSTVLFPHPCETCLPKSFMSLLSNSPAFNSVIPLIPSKFPLPA